MRVMGLDVGDRTIGVAVSDAMGWMAQGVETIRRTSWEKDLARLKELIAHYEVETIVCGLPKNMNGSVGGQGEKALEFAECIKQQTGLQVDMWDERLTTMAAEKTLISVNMRRNKRKQVIDTVAATFILQGYLDRQASHAKG